jgi:phospholipid/cholesterol/gamma-HCH transport system substrate-binding protein
MDGEPVATGSSPARPRLVGAFTVIALAIGLFALWAIGSADLFVGRRTFVVFFPNPVGGLKEGAPVTFRQAPVGQVRDVELVFTGQGMKTEIKVVADVRRSAMRNLGGQTHMGDLSDAEIVRVLTQAGLRASVRSSSPLAGQRALDLDFHPELEARYAGIPMPYPEIPTAPTGMEIIQEKVEQALERIAAFPVDEVLTQLRTTLQSVQTLLDSPDTKGAMRNLRAGLGTADRTFARAEKTMDGVDGLLGDARTGLSNADAAARRLASTLERLDKTLATVDRNLERTGDTQRTAGQTLDELTEVLKSLRHLVEAIERHPEALLQGKALPEEKRK